MRDYFMASSCLTPGREKGVLEVVEELMQILVGPEPITGRAEQALVRLLDLDFFGDPDCEARRVWNSLMCDVNQSVLGGEALDTRWAQEIMRKILELLLLTHEVSSRGQLIKMGKTKRGRTPVLRTNAWLPGSRLNH